MLQAAYGFVVFLSSACGLVMEIIAGRLIAPYVGMSLYTWTAIIAVVLAGLAVGHWIGGVLASPEVDARSGGRRVAGALAFAGVSSLASLVLLRVVSGLLLDAGLGPITFIILLTGALFFLPSLFVGIVSPILTKLALDAAGPLGVGRIIGRMFALGALGSIAGTLAAGYLFISWIGSTGTVVTVAAVYTVLALAFVVHVRMGIVMVFFLAGSGAGLFWWGTSNNAFQSPCQVESDYFCIRIVDYSLESGRESTMMILDHLVHSINDRDDPTLLYSPYIHFIDEVTKRRSRRKAETNAYFNAFFIGGGGYSLPRAWLNDFEAGNLVVAEMDPAVTAAARDYMWLPEMTPRMTIIHRDARAALQEMPRSPTFHVIFGDAFRDISIPAHLITRQFHREIATRLKPGGFYVVNVVDDGRDPRFLLSLIKTLNVDFHTVEVWKSLGENVETGRVTFVVLASDTPTPVAKIESIWGIERTWIRWPDEDLRRRVAATGIPILSDDYAPVDRLMSGLLLSANP